MLEFCRKTRGSISIFLVLILLPTITCAGIFLDLSRSRLADEVISSAADLALNTVLSEYDTELKDAYGLFGASQDSGEIMETAKQYFKESMISAHATGNGLMNGVGSLFGGGTKISDMLNIRTDGDITIEPMANSGLNNPALIKRGISEFMKYRAPVNGVEALYEKLKASEDVVEQMSNASAEAKMIEARDAFYAAEKALLKQGEIAYEAISEYENFKNHASKTMYDTAYWNGFSVYLSGEEKTVEERYKHAHVLLTMNLFNTHNADGDLSVNLVTKMRLSGPNIDSAFSAESRANAVQIYRLIVKLNEAVEKYGTAKKALDEAYNGFGAMASGDWGIQYWYQLSKKVKSQYEAYAPAANQVWEAYDRLENAVEYAAEDAMSETMKKPSSSWVGFDQPDENGKLSYQSIYDSLKSYYDRNIKGDMGRGGSQSFRSIGEQIGRVDTGENRELLKVSSVTEVYNIRNDLLKYRDDFKKAASLVEKARKESAEMARKIKKYKQAFDKWEECANDSQLDDSPLATDEEQGDRVLIQKEKDEGLLHLTEKSAEELAQRLKNIKLVFTSIQGSIEAIKYNGKDILSIYDYATFRSASGLDADAIPVKEEQLRKYAEETFQFEIEPQLLRILLHPGVSNEELKTEYEYDITDPYYPDLKENTPSLYEWLTNKFGSPTTGDPVTKDDVGYDVDDKDSAKDADKELDNKKGDTGEADDSEVTKGNSFRDWKGATLPSKSELEKVDKNISADISKVTESAGLLQKAVEMLQKGLVSIRDDLYMEDYLFSMLTYDTFDQEGAYSMLSKDEQKKVTHKNADSYYKDKLEPWKASEANLSLTRFPRVPANNWCYGGEIEYIMYGSRSNSVNKAAAYAEIYAIRYALDLGIVFKTYWNDVALNALADALFAFAYIPIGATKTAACLAITAAEAGMDNLYLRKGLPVQLFKKDGNELFCSYDSIFKNKDQRPPQQTGLTLQYSDYLKMFMMVSLGFNENNVYLRTGDVIQANMAQLTENDKFDLSKSYTHYTLKANTKVNTMWSRFTDALGIWGLMDSDGWKSTSITTSRGY